MPKSSKNRVQISKFYPVENDEIINDPKLTAQNVKKEYPESTPIKGIKLGKNKIE